MADDNDAAAASKDGQVVDRPPGALKDDGAHQQDEEQAPPNLRLEDISDGTNPRGLPVAKFIDDVDLFAASFDPPASAELLIGAYTELHTKYKAFESSFQQKKQYFREKVPELEKSLALIRNLLKKKKEGEQGDRNNTGMVRYSLTDNVFAKAELDYSIGTVNLWLGANVMLEFTYEEAIEFLTKNQDTAKRQLDEMQEDLAFVRDQIVTSEVSISRIYNWDVRRRRQQQQEAGNNDDNKM